MMNQQSDKFKTADLAAQQYSANQTSDESGLCCPLPQKHVIEVQVVGMDNKPLAGVAVELRNDDKVLRRKTNHSGLVRFTGLEQRPYQMSLWQLDKDAWELLKNENLIGDLAKSQGEAVWQKPPANKDNNSITHVVEQGECIGKISERYGFFPETVRDFAENAELKDIREDMYILAPGDKLVIPAKRDCSVAVETGKRFVVNRKGVPEILRIRFLDYDDSPRINAPYLISLKTLDGELVADRKGNTNTGGFVIESVPPNVNLAKITLGDAPYQEVYDFRVGEVNPIDSVRGVQARLNNLGYHCGAEDDKLGPKTEAAIRMFETEFDLETSGVITDTLKSNLQKRFLS